MAEQVQSGPQQSRARRFLGAGKRTLDGEDRSERIKTGRKGTLFRAFSPTIKPEFPRKEGPALGRSSLERSIRALLTEEGASSRWKRKPPRRARLARSRAPISAYWRAISPSVRDISHCPR